MPNQAYLNYWYDKTSNVSGYYSAPFTITVLDDNVNVGYHCNATHMTYAFYVSVDEGLNWAEWKATNSASGTFKFNNKDLSQTFNTGDRIIIVGENTYVNINFINFWCSGRFKIEGNLLSLIDRNNYSSEEYIPSLYNEEFKEFFKNQTTLVDAENLVFPEVSATRLYKGMFKGCTGLKTGPSKLPSATAIECFAEMFSGCTNLHDMPVMPATTLSDSCYSYMFQNCTSLIVGGELPATTMAPNCYEAMFIGCTGLLQQPRLPATTLANGCYSSMFYGCTSLTIPTPLPATTLAQSCYSYMFYGCNHLMTAPDLKTETLVQYCYEAMFYGCSRLNYIKCLAFSTSAPGCLDSWVYAVAPSGTFVKDPNATIAETGSPTFIKDNISGVPIGWLSQNDDSIPTYDYTVYVETVPNGYGNTSGQGSYAPNEQCTLYAWANSNYVFLGWYVGSNLLSNQSQYTFTVTSNIHITACFGEISTTYYSLRRYYGTDLNNLTFDTETEWPSGYQYTAGPNEIPSTTGTYTFQAWYTKSRNDTTWTQYSTDQYITVTINGDMDLCALYQYTSNSQDIYLKMAASPDTFGQYSISYSGVSETRNDFKSYAVPSGSTVSLTALPGSGYIFDYWQLNGIEYSRNSSIILTPQQDCYLTAMFRAAPTNYDTEYFTIEAQSSNTAVSINIYENEYFIMEYSVNNGLWRQLTCRYNADTAQYESGYSFNGQLLATLSSGDNIRIRMNRGVLENAQWATSSSQGPNVRNRFIVNNLYKIKGNLMSLVNYSTSSTNTTYVPTSTYVVDYAFYSAFRDEYNLTDASDLTISAVAAGKYAFSNMFAGCNKMTSGPASISVPSLGDYACSSMFLGCIALLDAPDLDEITSFGAGCFNSMLYGCVSVVSAPAMPTATTLSDSCYAGMFSYCRSLLHAPTLSITTMKPYCYSGMFVGCTMLQEAPALPATTLADSCYQGMFESCTQLNFAPVLPATTLATACYNGMFQDCNNLCYIKIMSTDPLYGSSFDSSSNKDALMGWVKNVSSKGNFIRPANLSFSYPVDSISGVPIGWTEYDAGTGEPEPGLIDDVELLGNVSYAGVTTDTLPWYELTVEEDDVTVGSPNGTVTATQDGIQIYNPYSDRIWLPQILIYGDDGCVLQQGHNYKVEILLKADTIDPDSYQIRLALGEWGNVMYKEYYIVDTGDEFVKMTFDFSNFHNDDHTDPDDTEEAIIILQTGNFKGYITVKDVKLYEYGTESSEQGTKYTVNTIYDESMGSVSGSGQYSSGTTVTLTATPITGYNFVHWLKNGVILSTSTTYSFSIIENVTIEAVFELDQQESSDYAHRYLTIEAVQDTVNVYYGGLFNPPYGSGIQPYVDYIGEQFTLYYSIKRNGYNTYSEWTPVIIPAATGTTNNTYICQISTGDCVRLHGTASSLLASKGNTSIRPRVFYITGKFKAYGNPFSLKDAGSVVSSGTNYGHPIVPDFSGISMEDYQFEQLFSKSNITDASNIKLTSMTLTRSCYAQMFYKCFELTNAPVLPATNLAWGCYAEMFRDCQKLNYAPALPANTLAENCYEAMFYGCTSLITAPVLNAPTLVYACYEYMFNQCTSLNYIKCLATNYSSSYTLYWTLNVQASGTFIKAPDVTWSSGTSGIPSGWTVTEASS